VSLPSEIGVMSPRLRGDPPEEPPARAWIERVARWSEGEFRSKIHRELVQVGLPTARARGGSRSIPSRYRRAHLEMRDEQVVGIPLVQRLS